jgi:hypothetical protein
MYEYRKEYVQSYGFIHRCLICSWLNLTEYDTKKKVCSRTCLTRIKDFIKIYFTIISHFYSRSKKIKTLNKTNNYSVKTNILKNCGSYLFNYEMNS